MTSSTISEVTVGSPSWLSYWKVLPDEVRDRVAPPVVVVADSSQTVWEEGLRRHPEWGDLPAEYDLSWYIGPRLRAYTTI